MHNPLNTHNCHFVQMGQRAYFPGSVCMNLYPQKAGLLITCTESRECMMLYSHKWEMHKLERIACSCVLLVYKVEVQRYNS